MAPSRKRPTRTFRTRTAMRRMARRPPPACFHPVIALRAPRKIATSAKLCESELWQQDSRVGTMGQLGVFDADRRLAAITAKGDPLEMIARAVPVESFRAEIEAAVLTPVSEKRSSAGRKPIDVRVVF